MSWVLLVLGILLLYLGGETLVRNATRLARALGISPLVVGLTVVAFGTSAPELAATVTAALKGAPGVALGNVVGSNIANLGLILGLAALISPLRTTARFLRREVPFMLGVSVLMFGLVQDGMVTRANAAVLLLLLGVYLTYLLREEREPPEVEAEFVEAYGADRVPVWRGLLGVGAGVGLLVLGADALVEGAVALARGFGVSERVIGLTVVAVGTSLPELASALVAALRRESDIVLGNLVGSNVFNVLAILGVTALVRPVPVQTGAVQLDLGVMLGLSVLVWPFLYTGYRLGRREGAALLLAYLGYVILLYA